MKWLKYIENDDLSDVEIDAFASDLEESMHSRLPETEMSSISKNIEASFRTDDSDVSEPKDLESQDHLCQLRKEIDEAKDVARVNIGESHNGFVNVKSKPLLEFASPLFGKGQLRENKKEEKIVMTVSSVDC